MASPRKRQDWLNIGNGKTYAHRVHRPLQCLIFITPLLLFYQIGSTLHPWSPDPNYAWHVVAFILMLKFFALFGAAGNFLPLLTVVAILISWHLARRDPWDFDPKLYLGMAAESLLWAMPIFIIGLAVSRHTAGAAMIGGQAAGGGGPPTLLDQLVLSVGAGIYEELLFRLIAIILLNIILVDVFEMKTVTAIPVIIITSAVLFSGYHYLGNETFRFGVFFFRAAMGIYLAGIFIYRGFGIVVGAHAIYDIIVVFVTVMHGGGGR